MTNCKYCGGDFIPVPRSGQKFCTVQCRDLARSKRKSGKTKEKRSCRECGVTIGLSERVDKVYCSQKCKAAGSTIDNSSEAIAKRLIKKLVLETVEGHAIILAKDGTEIIVDASLAAWLSQYTWVVSDKGYPRHAGVAMHYILKTLWGWADMVCDHKDRNKLNNTKGNLRPCTMKENSSNLGSRNNKASGLKGVHRTASGKWQAMIWHEGKNVGLGSFDTCREAAEVYNTKALELKGEFAYQNII